ncbi:DUF6053 domain-containing protein [Lysobacter enzymogenes]|uniref:DUF6053 domain-containing protein n=1 Tax=Lysobacter enzymogenes TaxID=69 RepID=UPI003D2F8733
MQGPPAVVRGASAPMLSAQIAEIGHQSAGAEAPPTSARRQPATAGGFESGPTTDGPKKKTAPRSGAVSRSRPAPGRARLRAARAAAGRGTQSSPLDRSSSATTSAAAHSRASRSLRSRSAFSTASM